MRILNRELTRVPEHLAAALQGTPRLLFMGRDLPRRRSSVEEVDARLLAEVQSVIGHAKAYLTGA